MWAIERRWYAHIHARCTAPFGRRLGLVAPWLGSCRAPLAIDRRLIRSNSHAHLGTGSWSPGCRRTAPERRPSPRKAVSPRPHTFTPPKRTSRAIRALRITPIASGVRSPFQSRGTAGPRTSSPGPSTRILRSPRNLRGCGRQLPEEKTDQRLAGAGSRPQPGSVDPGS